MKYALAALIRRLTRKKPKVTGEEKTSQVTAIDRAHTLIKKSDTVKITEEERSLLLKFRYSGDVPPLHYEVTLNVFRQNIDSIYTNIDKGRKQTLRAITRALDAFNRKHESSALMNPSAMLKLAEVFKGIANNTKLTKEQHDAAAKALENVTKYFIKNNEVKLKLEAAINLANLLLVSKNPLKDETKEQALESLVNIIDRSIRHDDGKIRDDLGTIHTGTISGMVNQLVEIKKVLETAKSKAVSKRSEIIALNPSLLKAYEEDVTNKDALLKKITDAKKALQPFVITSTYTTTHTTSSAEPDPPHYRKDPSPLVKEHKELGIQIRQQTLDSLAPGEWLDDTAVTLALLQPIKSDPTKGESADDKKWIECVDEENTHLGLMELEGVPKLQMMLPSTAHDFTKESAEKVLEKAQEADQEHAAGNRISNVKKIIAKLKSKAAQADLILIPLHIDNHWTTLAFDRRKEPHEFHFYSSLPGYEKRAENYARTILTHLDGKDAKLVFHKQDMPQQKDGHQCGIYMKRTFKVLEKLYRDDPTAPLGSIVDKFNVSKEQKFNPQQERESTLSFIDTLSNKTRPEWKFEISGFKRDQIKKAIVKQYKDNGVEDRNFDEKRIVINDARPSVMEGKVIARGLDSYGNSFLFVQPADIKQCRYTDEQGHGKLMLEYVGKTAEERRKTKSSTVVHDWIHYAVPDKDAAVKIGDTVKVELDGKGLTTVTSIGARIDKDELLSPNTAVAQELAVQGPIGDDDLQIINVHSKEKINTTNLSNFIKQTQPWHTEINGYIPITITSRNTLILHNKDEIPPFHEISLKRLEMEGVTEKTVQEMITRAEPVSIPLKPLTMERAACWLTEQNLNAYLQQKPKDISMPHMSVSGDLSAADVEVLRYKTGRADLKSEDVNKEANLKPETAIEFKGELAHITARGTAVYLPESTDYTLVESTLARQQIFSTKPDVASSVRTKYGQPVRIKFEAVTAKEMEKKIEEGVTIPKPISPSRSSSIGKSSVRL